MNKILVNNNDSLIKVPDGAEVFILDKSTNPLKIEIGINCKVDYLAILNNSCEREIIIGDNSMVNINGLYLSSGQFKINNHLGREVVLNSQILSYQKNDQLLQIEDNYIFADKSSVGKIIVNALVDNQATTNYLSDIIIKREAIETETRIDMKLYLLSRQARGLMLPGLKIATNAVKAGHGASTNKLTPEDLFYLKSRGLSEEQAKKIVIDSIVKNFLITIKDDEYKKMVSSLVIL
ncbi:MAG: SufD family Fe-S cluster assembly protein [Patescibacteria group bacterium]